MVSESCGCPLLCTEPTGQPCDYEQFAKGRGGVKDVNCELGGQMCVTLERTSPLYHVIFLGRFGYGALGVVFTIVGIFLIVAAIQFNPHQARGLDTALKELLHLPFGPFLLGIVALGLFAYGLYSFVEARYRRLGGRTLG